MNVLLVQAVSTVCHLFTNHKKISFIIHKSNHTVFKSVGEKREKGTKQSVFYRAPISISSGGIQDYPQERTPTFWRGRGATYDFAKISKINT